MVSLSEPQRYAARMSATGLPAKVIAGRLGVSAGVVSGWMKLPAFVAARAEVAERVEEALEEDLIGATGEMLDLWRRWMRGEVVPSDPRIAVIAPTILRWTETIFGIAAPAGAGAKGAAGPSIQILNAPGVAAPRLRGVEDDPDAIFDELRSLPPPRENRKRRQAAAGADPV